MFTEKTLSENSQKLKIKRESMGLSLDDVFKKIRIRASYLQDIENSQFHLLPDPVYTRNFIKTYAKFLGIDEDPVLQDYDAFINARKEEQAPPEAVPEGNPFFTSVANKKNYWGLISVLVIVLIIWFVVKQNTPVPMEIESAGKIHAPAAAVQEQNVNALPNATSAENQQMAVNVVTNGSIVEGGTANTAPLEKQIASGSLQKNILFISAIEETWIRVKPDDSPSIQILLKPGDKFENNAETYNLDIGNAGGIKIQYKGKDIGNLGKTGEVVHMQLPQLTNKN